MTKMRCILCALAAATLFFLSAAGAGAGELKLTIADGRVSIVADNVPVRTIMTEWARIGQTRIVNADKLVGPPVTLRLENVTETEALDVLLRSASGYVAAPRPLGAAGVSQYDRIMILASSRPTSAPASSSTPPFPSATPRFGGMPAPMVAPVDPDDDEDPAGDHPPPGTMLQPGFHQPVPGQPPQIGVQPMPPGTQNAPGLTLPRPGMLPVPQQPGQQKPNQPNPIP